MTYIPDDGANTRHLPKPEVLANTPLEAAGPEERRPADSILKSPFEDGWKFLSHESYQSEDWFSTDPPPRQYLLKTKDEAGSSVGMLPLGRVGMLAAAGGTGKTWALIQLALAVATGKPWFETYSVVKPGPVLLLLAEEELSEVRRRFYHAAQLINLTDTEKDIAKRKLMPLCLAGKNVALTQSQTATNGTDLPLTLLAADLLNRLKSSAVEWSLIILDPLSRFAGPDVEIDNAQATRFVQALETLTTAPGNPTVLIAHHVSKAAKREGASADASAARGASGLTDGVRWQANLVPHEVPGFTALTVTKSNCGWIPQSLTLAKDRTYEGAFRLPTVNEKLALGNGAATESHKKAKPLKSNHENHGTEPVNFDY